MGALGQVRRPKSVIARSNSARKPLRKPWSSEMAQKMCPAPTMPAQPIDQFRSAPDLDENPERVPSTMMISTWRFCGSRKPTQMRPLVADSDTDIRRKVGTVRAVVCANRLVMLYSGDASLTFE